MRKGPLLALLALAAGIALLPAQAQAWKDYPYTAGLLAFPRDEGNHQLASSEWWYWVANLRGTQSGRRYSVIVSYIKPYLQLSRVVDIGRGLTWGGVDFGLMTTKAGWLDIDFLASASRASTFNLKPGTAFEYEVTYLREGVSLSGYLVARKPPHPLGGSGFLQQLPGTFTWYFAQTRLDFSGSISTPGGGVEPVTGLAWIDRQWYDPWMSDGDYWGHQWFSIQLDNGREIEAYKTWGADGGEPFPLLDLVKSDGDFEHFNSFSFAAQDPWTDPATGYIYPLKWRIVQSDLGLDLNLTATLPDQSLYPGFWEGSCRVTGTLAGQPVSGWAFSETAVADIRLRAVRDPVLWAVGLSWEGGVAPFVVERASRPDFADAVILDPAAQGRSLADPVLDDGRNWFYRLRCTTPGRCAP